MSMTYTTIQGDMWDSIAHSQLGDVSYMDRLISLNTAYREYYIFPAGIVLILPEVVADEASIENLPPWKLVSG